MPKKLVKLAATRWLAWGKAIDVLLQQHLELKTHFQAHVGSMKPSDKCTVARKLNECYRNEQFHLMLLFLKPITAEVNKLNLKFQATNGEASFTLKPSHLKNALTSITLALLCADCGPCLKTP